GAAHGGAGNRRQALGQRCVAAPGHAHLAVDDHSGDAGNVTARDRAQRVGRERRRGRVADDEVGRLTDRERGRAGKAKGAGVVAPPLTWPQTSGRRCRSTSWVIGLEPGIELPPLCDMTQRPCFCARRTSGSPSRGWAYPPKPYLACRTPCLAIS